MCRYQPEAEGPSLHPGPCTELFASAPAPAPCYLPRYVVLVESAPAGAPVPPGVLQRITTVTASMAELVHKVGMWVGVKTVRLLIGAPRPMVPLSTDGMALPRCPTPQSSCPAALPRLP